MNYEVVDIILRPGAAAAAGVIIGINRDLTNKPIGQMRGAATKVGPKQSAAKDSPRELSADESILSCS